MCIVSCKNKKDSTFLQIKIEQEEEEEGLGGYE